MWCRCLWISKLKRVYRHPHTIFQTIIRKCFTKNVIRFSLRMQSIPIIYANTIRHKYIYIYCHWHKHYLFYELCLFVRCFSRKVVSFGKNINKIQTARHYNMPYKTMYKRFLKLCSTTTNPWMVFIRTYIYLYKVKKKNENRQQKII